MKKQIKLEDLERKILSLKELDLSRQEVLNRTRSYVDKCVDISTFQELKEIVFKHIPKKIFSTAPRKLYEWVETREDGVEHIHSNYWKDLPKQVRFQIIQWKRYKTTKLKSNDRPKHKSKGCHSVGREHFPTGKDTYIKDRDSDRIYKLKTGITFSSEVRKLDIHIDRNVPKEELKGLYKKQNTPKPVTIKKVVKVKATKAIVPERGFIHGNEQLYSLAYNPKTKLYDSNIDKAKDDDIIFELIPWKLIPKEYRQYLTRKRTGMVLTEKGEQEKRDLYTKFKVDDRVVEVERIIKLIDEYTIDFYKLPKDSRESTYIKPPKINTNKRLAKVQDRLRKETKKYQSIEEKRLIQRKLRKGYKKAKDGLLKYVESLGIKTTRSLISPEAKLSKELLLKERRIKKSYKIADKESKVKPLSTYQLNRKATIKGNWLDKQRQFEKYLAKTHKIYLSKRYKILKEYYKNKKKDGINTATKK